MFIMHFKISKLFKTLSKKINHSFMVRYDDIQKIKIKTHDTLSNDALHEKGHILLGIIEIMRYKHYLGIC